METYSTKKIAKDIVDSVRKEYTSLINGSSDLISTVFSKIAFDNIEAYVSLQYKVGGEKIGNEIVGGEEIKGISDFNSPFKIPFYSLSKQLYIAGVNASIKALNQALDSGTLEDVSKKDGIKVLDDIVSIVYTSEKEYDSVPQNYKSTGMSYLSGSFFAEGSKSKDTFYDQMISTHANMQDRGPILSTLTNEALSKKLGIKEMHQAYGYMASQFFYAGLMTLARFLKNNDVEKLEILTTDIHRFVNHHREEFDTEMDNIPSRYKHESDNLKTKFRATLPRKSYMILDRAFLNQSFNDPNAKEPTGMIPKDDNGKDEPYYRR